MAKYQVRYWADGDGRWRETLLNIFVTRASFPYCLTGWVGLLCCWLVVRKMRANIKLVYASVCLSCILPTWNGARIRCFSLSSFLLWFSFNHLISWLVIPNVEHRKLSDSFSCHWKSIACWKLAISRLSSAVDRRSCRVVLIYLP